MNLLDLWKKILASREELLFILNQREDKEIYKVYFEVPYCIPKSESCTTLHEWKLESETKSSFSFYKRCDQCKMYYKLDVKLKGTIVSFGLGWESIFHYHKCIFLFVEPLELSTRKSRPLEFSELLETLVSFVDFGYRPPEINIDYHLL